jgi:hypothetical protein
MKVLVNKDHGGEWENPLKEEKYDAKEERLPSIEELEDETHHWDEGAEGM